MIQFPQNSQEDDGIVRWSVREEGNVLQCNGHVSTLDMLCVVRGMMVILGVLAIP